MYVNLPKNSILLAMAERMSQIISQATSGKSTPYFVTTIRILIETSYDTIISRLSRA